MEGGTAVQLYNCLIFQAMLSALIMEYSPLVFPRKRLFPPLININAIH